jgi:hypothetical protein
VTDRSGTTQASAETVAGEILRYLRDHPKAADTLDGIANWWLPRQRLTESVSLVRGALTLLEARQEIDRQQMADGQVVYRLRPHREEAK